MDPLTVGKAAVALGAKSLVEKLVDKFVVPSLERLKSRKELADELVTIGIRGGLVDYLSRSFDRHSFVSTLVFPGQRIQLSELYLPLTVVRWSNIPSGEGREAHQITGFADNFLPKHKRIFLVDNAGMGKSTLAKYLFLKCVEEQKGTPVLVELRQLSGKTDIVQHVLQKVCGLADSVSPEALLHLIVEGNFVFLLDGYDEIAPSEKAEVTRNLQAFIERASRNLFLLTSRPDPALQTFSEFERFEIRPLRKDEAFSLVRRYDRTGELADHLISEIEKPKNSQQLRDYLVNPLLVSLLFKAYEWKSVLPLRKHLFYEQVYNALYDMHDISKGGAYQREKRSALDSNEFHRVLRAFAFRSLLEGKVEYPKDLLTEILQEIQTSLTGIQFEAAGFLHDLLHAVPLFVEEGYGVRWSHKSMQEYFAAKYICTDAKGRQEDYLLALFEAKDAVRFANTLDLAHDIDVGSFNQVVLKRLCEDFGAYSSSILAIAGPGTIPEEDREARAALTFSQSFSVLPVEESSTRRASSKSRKALVRGRPRNPSARLTPVAFRSALEFALESARSAGMRVEEMLEPALMRIKGETELWLMSIPSGIRSLLIEMLGGKGADIVVRAESLVDGRRASVDDIAFGTEPVSIDDRLEASWNIEPQIVRNMNRLLAMHNVFVIHPRRSKEFLVELSASQQRAEAMDRLVKGLNRKVE